MDRGHLGGLEDRGRNRCVFKKPDGLYYAVVIADVFCIFLDSSSGTISAEQYRWLEDLLKRGFPNAVIFTHYPILDCGDTAMDRLYPLENRERVAELLQRSDKQISIFCGHYHTSHEQEVGNISQYVTPSALLQIKQRSDKIEMESKDFGFRLIYLSPDIVQTDVVLFSK